jgi:hypothetical protein
MVSHDPYPAERRLSPCFKGRLISLHISPSIRIIPQASGV